MTFIGIPALIHLAASANIPNGSDGWSASILASVTADRTGQWIVVVRATTHGAGCGARVMVNGAYQGGNAGQGYFWHTDVVGNRNGDPATGDYWQGVAGAGTTFGVQVATSTISSPGPGFGSVDAWFIPTAQYPK